MRLKNDGSYLEEEVQKILSEEKSENFRFRRLYDTKTAGKGMPPQPADFFISCLGVWPRSMHLECKTSNHIGGRLPTFSQLGDLLAWDKAGVPGYVLVHFYTTPALYLFRASRIEDTLAKSWVVPEIPGAVELKLSELLPLILRKLNILKKS